MDALQLRQLDILPGQRILLRDISWQEFEAIIEDLGEHRSTRLAYSNGTLEVMAPLPEHEKTKSLIGHFVIILLEEFQLDYEGYASTTFKRKDTIQGIEPDESFYIQNCVAMRGMDRIDLTVDPPPDLAIEIDVTSKTQLDVYTTLGVPELWQYSKGKLQIFCLQDGKYKELAYSPNFPKLSLTEAIPKFIERSKIEGRSAVVRAFRVWVKEQIELCSA